MSGCMTAGSTSWCGKNPELDTLSVWMRFDPQSWGQTLSDYHPWRARADGTVSTPEPVSSSPEGATSWGRCEADHRRRGHRQHHLRRGLDRKQRHDRAGGRGTDGPTAPARQPGARRLRRVREAGECRDGSRAALASREERRVARKQWPSSEESSGRRGACGAWSAAGGADTRVAQSVERGSSAAWH